MGASLFGRRLSAAATQAFHYSSVLTLRSEVPLGDEKREPPVIHPEAPVFFYALITAPRAETKVEEALHDAGFASTYVPRRTYWLNRRIGKTRQRIEKQGALFPRYCFFAFPKLATPAWRTIKDIDGVIGVAGTDGKPSPIHPSRLAAIANQEAVGWFDEMRRPQLEAALNPVRGPLYATGDQVRVIEGPFVSFPAIVAHDVEHGAEELRIEVAVFGRATPMVIPISAVEAIA